MITLNLCGYKVEVHRLDDVKSDDGDDCFGTEELLGDEGYKLCIGSHLGGQRLTETLLHESMHAISDLLDLGLSEQQVRALGVGLSNMWQGRLTLDLKETT
jgi:hypothetical protein